LLATIGGASRAAVQIGECEVRDGVLVGPALDAALAVARVATPGEVLVSGSVRDLVADPKLLFRERRTIAGASCRLFAATVG
jgi:class 3 adenylate cyclase